MKAGAPTASATAAAFFGQSRAASVALDLPAESPQWLRDIVRVLSAADLGPHYKSLLQMLIRLENKFGPSEKGRAGISTTHRPAEVQAWIRAGRGLRSKAVFDAGIEDLEDYAKRWSSWWDSLQPEWRTRDADGQWTIGVEYGNDWDTLWVPGQNGLSSVVASLYFWGSSSRAMGTNGLSVWNRDELERWERAVQDVVWMVEGLEQAVPSPKGRKGKK
ncbi:hypothetical protein B0H11DRAFT_1719305 [Mycena galericulata]|nr:hypothetical protein B0H11DRAFT_1719305 [Mycena galericulata]